MTKARQDSWAPKVTIFGQSDEGSQTVVPIRVDSNGGIVKGVNPTSFSATVTISSSSPTLIKSSTAGKRMFITSLIISCSASMNVAIEDEGGTESIKPLYFSANGGLVYPIPIETPIIIAEDKDLRGDSSSSSAYSVTVTGYFDD